jgi:hypothetical protein
MTGNCPFCEIVSDPTHGRILAQDDNASATDKSDPGVSGKGLSPSHFLDLI